MNQERLEAKQFDSNASLLRPVAYFLAFLYVVLTVAHVFLLQESFKWILIPAALVTAAINTAVGFRANYIDPTRKEVTLLLLIFLASANSFLHLWLSQAPEQTTNTFVTIIASGIVLSHRALWCSAVLFNWVGWIVISNVLEMALIQHFFFAMVMSTLLSWFAHLARKNLVGKQLELERERDIALEHEKEAKAATEAKSAFLANMSHEIRTPMNGVIGMIELVSQTKLEKVQQDYIATAKRSADSLMVIINDILDFSKIEVGELTIELVEFDIEQFFSELVHDQQFQASKKGLKLSLIKEELQHTKVVGDPYRIRQIMNNLLSNAIKFTQAGHILVRFSLTCSGDDLQLHCAVTDTGIGVSDEALPYLFDSFTQADTSTTRKFGGTGLGLSISKQLCALMGGDIKVHSQLDKGSTFEFCVKLASPQFSNTEQEEPNAALTFPNAQVLLVEDNFINQEVMLAILHALAVQVYIANDGLEAISTLKRCQKTRFDLILMDCQMPNLDGYETTKRIRAGEAGELFKSIPIAALTANVLDSERLKCFESGMNEYLTKPVDFDALKSILYKYQHANLEQ